jgi:hypothetical protein
MPLSGLEQSSESAAGMWRLRSRAALRSQAMATAGAARPARSDLAQFSTNARR